MQVSVGRPKDLEKRQRILTAAKQLFLEFGYHGSSMNRIAQAADVTKLTVYNHFQDKATLFTAAIEETCEAMLQTRPHHLSIDSDFSVALYDACLFSMNIVNLPEAIKLDHLLMELSSQQNPLAIQFYNASHNKLHLIWNDFFAQANQFGFIQIDQPDTATTLLSSLLFGLHHQQVLFGMRARPDQNEIQSIIEHAIAIFRLKYPFLK